MAGVGAGVRIRTDGRRRRVRRERVVGDGGRMSMGRRRDWREVMRVGWNGWMMMRRQWRTWLNVAVLIRRIRVAVVVSVGVGARWGRRRRRRRRRVCRRRWVGRAWMGRM
jgi:hypothetical protein